MNFDKPKDEFFEPSKEFIEAVEKSKLDANDKANLLLVKAGLKPAAEIELMISLKTDDDTQTYLTEDEVQKSIALIENSGLSHKIGERKFVKGSYTIREEPGKPETKKPTVGESIPTFVAGSQEKLDALSEIWDTEDEEAIGKALGIPKSAVEAFTGKREAINLYELPDDIQNKEAAVFLTPTLSKENWREEMKEGTKRAAFIKRICPSIYKELIKREHEE
jgi:hypothetical protein